ncbi:hypothetical protein Lfu02_49460 [Longispora fulva]|nr:hypothetical protein Lfu02_49460 [Longispora fulva]
MHLSITWSVTLLTCPRTRQRTPHPPQDRSESLPREDPNGHTSTTQHYRRTLRIDVPSHVSPGRSALSYGRSEPSIGKPSAAVLDESESCVDLRQRGAYVAVRRGSPRHGDARSCGVQAAGRFTASSPPGRPRL